MYSVFDHSFWTVYTTIRHINILLKQHVDYRIPFHCSFYLFLRKKIVLTFPLHPDNQSRRSPPEVHAEIAHARRAVCSNDFLLHTELSIVWQDIEDQTTIYIYNRIFNKLRTVNLFLIYKVIVVITSNPNYTQFKYSHNPIIRIMICNIHIQRNVLAKRGDSAVRHWTCIDPPGHPNCSFPFFPQTFQGNAAMKSLTSVKRLMSFQKCH